MFWIGLVVLLCVSASVAQVPTRVTQFVVNSAINSQNTITLTGVDVYRDELVVLVAYGTVIGLRADNLDVVNSTASDDLTSLYLTVDDESGVLAVCTNREGRCQWMNVSTFEVLGFGPGIILSGESGVEVDERVLMILANTQGNISSLFTASGNALTQGLTNQQNYPIIATQLQTTLSEAGRFQGSPQNQAQFRRTYIDTFKSSGYIYFVTLDQIPGSEICITRICENDSLSDIAFHSIYYTRLVECGLTPQEVLVAKLTMLNNGTYKEFVVVTYTGSGVTHTCAYSIQSINEVMERAYQDCYIAKPLTIIPSSTVFLPVNVDQCLATGSSLNPCNLWAAGTTARVHLITATVSGTELTNRLSGADDIIVLIATQEENGISYTYYFVAVGNIVEKYLMDGLTLVLPALENISLTGTGDNSVTDLKLDQSEQTLYALTERELLRIPVSDCGRHTACEECVMDRDPLCGWCGVQNECNRLSQCENYNLTNRWIRDDVFECFSIESIAPNTANVNEMNNITLISQNLPELSGNEIYECVFQSSTSSTSFPVTAVNKDSNLIGGPVNGTANILCSAPNQTALFTQTDNLQFNISLSTNTFASHLDRILTDNYTLYYCGLNDNCSSCVNSNSPCGWCLYDTKCVPRRDQCVMQEWVEPSENDIKCPQINAISFDLPGDMNRIITLTSLNLPQPTMVYNYSCVVNISNTNIPAVWMNVSSGPSFDNTSLECLLLGGLLTPGVSGSVQIVWGPTDYVIQQGVIFFRVFECGSMMDCHSCLQNPQCNWCADTNNRTGRCSGECTGGENVFTPSDMMCPPPEIISFTPTSTAPGGIVVLSVSGHNLAGQIPLVTLGDIECSVRADYTNERILCDLTVPGTGGDRTLTVNVTSFSESGISSGTFSIRDPVILSVQPPYTPEFGGTVVTVNGTNLLVGVSRRLTFGTRPCEIISNTTDGGVDELECRTTLSGVGVPLMSIRIDSGVQKSFTETPFQVLENPEVLNLFLSGSTSELRGTFVFGGLDYNLRGRNLGATTTQTLVFTHNDVEISRTVCVPPADRESVSLFCAGNTFSVATPLQSGMEIRFQLIMDSVPNVTAPYFTPFSFTLYPDPLFQGGSRNFSISIPSGFDTISIPIQGLDSIVNSIPENAISITETRTEQNYLCSNRQITSTEIICTINQTIPLNTDNGLSILITIGQNSNKYELELEVFVVHKNPIVKFLEDNMAILATVLVILLLMLLIATVISLLLLCCIIRARSKSRKRIEEVFKVIEEFGEIEIDLAVKCWEGFKGLNAQVDSEVGSLQMSTIPILDFRTFAMRILFPGIEDHPVLHPVEGPRNVEPLVFITGLQKFDSLLRSKEFVRVMIHSMEDNPNFSSWDRRNVSSLLTVALYDSMPYLTELLLELLEELINENITKNTGKQLLRNTESLAENLLTDWLVFNLYRHLQGPVSESLYKLFVGIKNHIESGPVDVLTGEAVNSLSEGKLLKHEIIHKKLSVELDTRNGDRIACCVLDCDTITQTKLKLLDQEYKEKGFSQRPSPEDVDVFLLSAGRVSQQLRDNDMTNQEDGEWRKINTLSHYNVRDGMVLSLVERYQLPNQGQTWDYPGTTICDDAHIRGFPRLLCVDEESSKVYHLQKNETEGKEDYKHTHTLKRKHYVKEIYLPKLVATKRTLQSYMDQTMEQIFPALSMEQDNGTVPCAIKLLYDFLDEQARKYGIQDPATIHNWKSNCVPLRFWLNLLKNPEFLLDVAKSVSLDSTLSVLSQAFIDSCSLEQENITINSPTNKLLYHKEVQHYKGRVTQYYGGIMTAPSVQTSNLELHEKKLLSAGEDVLFHSNSAVYGLFSYARSYQDEIKNCLGSKGLDTQQRIFEEVCTDIAENIYMV